MSDMMIKSVGAVTPLSPESTRGQTSNGPSWYACEEPERGADVFAVWHQHGCAGCSERVRLAIVANGPGEFSANLDWLAARVDH